MTRFGYVMATYFTVLGIGITAFVSMPLRLVFRLAFTTLVRPVT
jgi:hypothetical protein